jgi:hypothetical protein
MQLLRDACGFWSLDPDHFSLFGSQYNYLIGITKNQQVSAYFEQLVLRHAVLYLLKPERDLL